MPLMVYPTVLFHSISASKGGNGLNEQIAHQDHTRWQAAPSSMIILKQLPRQFEQQQVGSRAPDAKA